MKLALTGWWLIQLVAQAQTLLNPGLEGSAAGSGVLPPDWSAVPFNDVNCRASSTTGATPDLFDAAGPLPVSGLFGLPQSGTSFVAGLDCESTSVLFGVPVVSVWHEGIAQDVGGFVPGQLYEVRFHQAVVKQSDARDTSGAWNVYVNNTLIGTSLPSVGTQAYNSSTLNWEARLLSFVAPSSNLTLKFFPQDDDANLELSNTDENGALRMGIDSITLQAAPVLPVVMQSFAAVWQHDQVALTWQAQATDLLQFVIERTNDPPRWQPIGTVAGQAWVDGSRHAYRFYDSTPSPGVNYYRLTYQDHDGTAGYSQTLSVVATPNHRLQLYPIPAERSLTVLVPEGTGAVAALHCYRSDGTLLSLPTSQRGRQWQIDVSACAAGLYVVELITLAGSVYRQRAWIR